MNTDLASKARTEGARILAFWRSRVLLPRGDFYGRVAADGRGDVGADKSLVLATRLLWTFSHAPRAGFSEVVREADDLFRGLVRFWDPDHGGFFWSLDGAGGPRERYKHVYGQSFAIYALAEYHALTRNPWALALAQATFRTLDRTARDARQGGYLEAFEADWSPREAPSPVNGRAAKSMNTHLHLLESLTALWRLWPDPVLKERLNALFDLLISRILNPATHHYRLFFTPDWTPLGDPRVSFGHDIEGSWLMVETAEALRDPERLSAARREALAMADAVLAEGMDSAGALVNEGLHGSIVDADKDWWPQAEGLVGLVNAYVLSGDDRYLRAAERLWAFVEHCLIDRAGGEWFAKTDAAGNPRRDLAQVDAWKCPYHNFRAMAELAARLG